MDILSARKARIETDGKPTAGFVMSVFVAESSLFQRESTERNNAEKNLHVFLNSSCLWSLP